MGVFGSVARGEDCPDSDVDVLVKFGKNGVKGLLGMVTRDFLSPYFREDVLAEMKPVYGKAQ